MALYRMDIYLHGSVDALVNSSTALLQHYLTLQAVPKVRRVVISWEGQRHVRAGTMREMRSFLQAKMEERPSASIVV